MQAVNAAVLLDQVALFDADKRLFLQAATAPAPRSTPASCLCTTFSVVWLLAESAG